MKIYGYIRDEDGNFDNRKNKVADFSKQMNFEIDEFICEKSSGDYKTMIKAKRLLEKEKDFILLVSDSSDLFENSYSKVMFLDMLEKNNVFLIDVYCTNFDYKMLIENNGKDNPFGFLINSLIVNIETYLRKKYSDVSDDIIHSDMITRLKEWKNNI